ncbi:MAG TPA: hypothetical protein VJY39_03010 [Acidisphaera sp.]|nr:hypothetical protein [Acidisphaera sp.]HME23749.1 hypothetical protein [Acetobacteraceae bacterium]
MTHLSRGGDTRLTSSLITRATTPVRLHLGIDRLQLRDAIASRRAALAALETAMVAACEQEAARAAGPNVRIDDRTTWNRPMWDRYLAAAADHEPDYMPRMLRLLGEIDRFERIMALTVVPEAKAT